MPVERKISPTHDAPYRGLRVLDFGQGIASPYCAMLLGVYGANVIKVEPPEGDWSRYLGTTYGSHTALSAVYNRGKRSLCLDLKHDEGIRIARRLAGNCDVLIEGFRPGVAARLGIGYETLARDNPGLIYLSVSGFGQDGPYSKRPGSDSVAQAFSGLVSVNVGNDKTPHRVGTTISDVATGVYAFQAIAPALFARASVGTGRWIDVSLTQSTAALLGHKLAEHVLEGGAPRALNVPAGSYQTKDGWLMVTLVNESQYKRLCTAIEREDLASDPRFLDFAKRADSADALISQMRDVFLTHSTETCLTVFMHRTLSRSEFSIPAIGCIMVTSRQRKPRLARKRPVLVWYTRRARRASWVFPRTRCGLRRMSERIAAQFSSMPALIAMQSTIWSVPASYAPRYARPNHLENRRHAC